MAKLSTPSHPCELVYVGGAHCGQRAFRKVGAHWYCRRHIVGIREGTLKSATGFMATPAGYRATVGDYRRKGSDRRRGPLTAEQELARRKRQAAKQGRDSLGRFGK
jgi:hypothetical protein